jgi:hypothetical protein
VVRPIAHEGVAPAGVMITRELRPLRWCTDIRWLAGVS